MKWPTGSLAVVLVLVAWCADAAEVVVSGTVRAAQVEGSAVHLSLEDPSSPELVLLVGWLSNFPPQPERFYVGKTISARGTQRSFRGVAEVHVRDVADITVLAEPNSGIVPAGSQHDEATTSEIQALRTRVRELEQRVRELEQQRNN